MRDQVVYVGIITLMVLSGCASIDRMGSIGDVAGDLKTKLIAPIVKPILGFTERDAKATLRWVEKKVKAGRLSSADATLARRCPDAVLEITEMGRLLDAPPEIEEGGALILFGTMSKFGGRPWNWRCGRCSSRSSQHAGSWCRSTACSRTFDDANDPDWRGVRTHGNI